MAFLEWRKFNFFDLKRDIDNRTLASKLNDILITATASGDNQIYLGDSLGQMHIVIRNWHVSTFSAYSLRVILAFKVKPYLITIGEDEEGVNPVIKVWDTNRLDKNDAPFCTRITKAIPNNTAVQANTLCVHENAQLMAVGFIDGSLILYRGDITRDRSSKPKLLRNASSAITGLAFKNSTKSVVLFVSTENAVYVYNITHKDKESMLQLDTSGCEKNCSILAHTLQGSHFMVARSDAVYCYTVDGRGPCYAIDGAKVMLEWFRTYLIIISRNNRAIAPSKQSASAVVSSSPTAITASSTLPALMYTITVLDIKNKFIVFTASVNAIRSLINELGGFYLLDAENRLHQLDEKDLQSKLQVLFKKNLYDVAIRIAESQKHDPEALVDIFRQYGDHLYGKGDHGGAIEQYTRTIGRLEPSYVIRKFLDSQHIERLTSYLQAVHKKGRATADHTTLLLNCFTKLNKTDNLKEFILQKDKDLVFNVDIAIKVCRHASPEEALILAKRHGKHDLYINFLLEDHKKYVEAINYISTLQFEEAELYMRKYGHILVEKAPSESTQFLKKICTNFNRSDVYNNGTDDIIDEILPVKKETAVVPNGFTDDEINGVEIRKADPYDFMSFFVGNSEKLVEFLEHLIAEQCQMSSHVYDTLLEHYLYVWETRKTPPERAAVSANLAQLLHNPDARYDRTQALLLCHQRDFSAGVLYLYERDKLYGQILGYHQERGDYDAVVACCRRFGHQEPGLWLQALKFVVSVGGNNQSYKKVLRKCSLQDTGEDTYVEKENEEISAPPVELLHEILNVIAKDRLLSPQQVVETIQASSRSDITLAHTDHYLINEFRREQQLSAADEELTAKYRVDTEKLRGEIDGLRTGNTIIQVSRCAACHYQLELPSLHFLCQHSYHQYCFQSISDSDQTTECPVCRPDSQQLLEVLKARGCGRDTHETFHSQLERSDDGVTLAAEYFGRGVFDRVTLVTDAGGKDARRNGAGGADKLAKKVADGGAKDSDGISAVLKPVGQDPTVSINYSNYGPGAEAKMRREERLRTANSMIIKPMSEGRIRAQENRYSNSMETARSFNARKVDVAQKVERKIEPVKRPFEAANPFNETIATNPFDEEEMDEEPDDYDKDGKNPFFEE